jgi:hypothetical protein
MLNFMACIGPKAEEKGTINFGKPICNPVANVVAFISNLKGQTKSQKFSKLATTFFSPYS